MIEARSSGRHGFWVDVGAEDRDLGRRFRLLRFAHHNGDGIDFLPGRAARHPDANVIIGTFVGDHVSHNRRESVESVRVTKELGHADQNLPEQQVEFVWVSSETLKVRCDVIDLKDLHAPLNAAP